MIRRLYDLVCSVFFASKCPCCTHAVKAQGSVCPHCWNQITFITGVTCLACGRVCSNSADTHYCDQHCLQSGQKLKEVKVVTVYEKNIAQIIHQFKYEDKTHHSNLLSKLLWQAFCCLKQDIDLVMPVPLHSKRLKQRSYNQSAILARSVAMKACKNFCAETLQRSRDTPFQMGLREKQRRANVRGAFFIVERNKELVAGRNILLVDDVITTGATIRECAEVLLSAGAASVSAIAVART